MTRFDPIDDKLAVPIDEDDDMALRARPRKGAPEVATETTPSTHYFAKAIELRLGVGGFHGQYGIPGLLPARVKDGGVVRVFATAEEAEIAAAARMIEVLNSRNVTLNVRGSNFQYEPMTPQQFAMGLSEANITPTLFSYLFGNRLHRVQGWLSGPTDKDDNRIPHAVRVILALFAINPDNIEIAKRVTDAVATDRRKKGE